MGPATYYTLFGDLHPEIAPPPVHAWQDEKDAIVEQHLSGLALDAIRRHSFPVPESVVTLFRDCSFTEVLQTQFVLAGSKHALELLSAGGVKYVISKGPGITSLSGGPSHRPYTDLDVIVDRRDFGRALALLIRAGYSERAASAPTWPIVNVLCREAVNLRNQDGASIDLHHRPAPWLWSSRLTRATMQSGIQPMEIGGVFLPVVAPVHNLLIAALHIVSDRGQAGMTFRAWRDVAVLARSCSVDSVIAEAERSRLTGWLFWIIDSMPEGVRPVELHRALGAARARVPHRWRLYHLLPPHFASKHVMGQVLRLPLPNGAVFIAGMIVPSRLFLRAKYPRENRLYLRWWRESLRLSGSAKDESRIGQ